MALSKKAREVLVVATAHAKAGKEIADAIDAASASSHPQAADVAAVSAAAAATQTSSYVQADAQSIATLANANKAAINAILSSLKAAGLMA
jgi:hypothetical protein